MKYLITLSIAFVSFSALAQGPVDNADLKRPNVILIMCDDLGWGDVGFNGNEKIKTPNLDRLAGQGTKFNRFYSAGGSATKN